MSANNLVFRVLRRLVLELRRLPLRLLFPTRIAPHKLKPILWPVLPVRTNSRHQEITLLRSIDRQNATSRRLLELASESARLATDIRLNDLEARISSTKHVPEVASLLSAGWSPNLWPGEHYRYLSALCRVCNAKSVVEIGTFWGHGALALADGVKATGGSVVTFDVQSWESFPATILKSTDFKPKFKQILADIQSDEVFEAHREIFEGADLIFMDAAKDGVMERKFLAHFYKCRFKPGTVLVVDDIHLWNMLDIWD